MQEGLKLPVETTAREKQTAEGFCTPTQDGAPQVACFPPRRVLPIVFLPGIMGSNLKITSKDRQKALGQKHNKAWRPDDFGLSSLASTIEASKATAAERQLRLDPLTTDVDVYDPSGPADVSGDVRHANVKLAESFDSPLLVNDPPTKPGRQTAAQKARRRGWSEVMFSSYGKLLQHLETRLNGTFTNGVMREEWRDVVGVDPTLWQADARTPQQALTEDEFRKAVSGCIFPVYAIGYNWLQSNGDSAKAVAQRIEAVIAQWPADKYECEKVIVVTHSMGGLVARGLIHPDHGNLKDKVLGMVHGVMPAAGAGTAYRRMRAGFENPGQMASKIMGNAGDKVTPVLANAPGGLELLPSKAYGNGWLKAMFRGEILGSWPKNGDPYEEIYKLKEKWYGLIREEWINPSGLSLEEGGGDFSRTVRYINQARDFHDAIQQTYHDAAYAHYGIDPKRKGWGDVVWEISDNCMNTTGWQEWPVLGDTKQGTVDLVRWIDGTPNQALGGLRAGPLTPNPITASLLGPNEAGDQTVPMRSADDQLRSSKFKGVFRQHGYEHQDSYQDRRALASTLYGIVRIAQQARWKDST